MSALLRSAGRALRDFLAGFTGIPRAADAAPHARCAHDARRALTEAAEKRGRCC